MKRFLEYWFEITAIVEWNLGRLPLLRTFIMTDMTICLLNVKKKKMSVLRETFSDSAGSSEGWRPSCLCISCYISCHLAHGTFNPQLSAEGRTERNNGCFYTLASKRQLACISRHIGSVLIRGWRALGTCTPPRLGGQTAPSIPHYKVICPKMLLVSLSFHLSHLTRKWRGNPRCSLL